MVVIERCQLCHAWCIRWHRGHGSGKRGGGSERNIVMDAKQAEDCTSSSEVDRGIRLELTKHEGSDFR